MAEKVYSVNKNKGLDFQLRKLGLSDRAPWDIISTDSKVFKTECFVGRPDFVLINEMSKKIIVMEYKNRIMLDQPEVYERI